MAEILVQAKPHWMDGMTQPEIDALSEDKKASRNARIQIGDIVVVKPDGWVWGNEECLPNYLVVKLPQLDVATVEHLIQALMSDPESGEEPVLLKKRKYQIPYAWVEPYITAEQSVIEVTLTAQQQNFLNNLIEKTS